MAKHVVCFVLMALLAAATPRAQDKSPAPYPVMAPVEQYMIPSREAEIALARAAAPPSISAAADVFVLGRRGYERAVKGTNGFVCLVERSWTASLDDPEFWNPRVRAPNCFNPPAARSVLPQYLKRTEWVMAGATRQQVIEKTRAAFAGHRFVVPEAGSLTFMLSKEGYVSDQAGGPWLPHLMFFVRSGQAAAWGAGLKGSPISATNGRPIEPTVLMIPVRRWSDGSAALPRPAP